MSQNTVSFEQEPRVGQRNENAFNRSFCHGVATAGNVRIHYVIGGTGPLVALLHGFPQHRREWRLVMPALADAGYTVVVPDLRGFGYSDKPLDGFDVGTVAEDIRQIIGKLGRVKEKVRIVGHDVGSAVAYAWAAAHPEQVEQLVLMEGLPEGLEPSGAGTPMLQGQPPWHLAFGMTPDVPERLLADRERIFVEFLLRRGCYDPTTFSDEEIDAYARPLAALGGVRGALAHIRAIPSSAALKSNARGERARNASACHRGRVEFWQPHGRGSSQIRPARISSDRRAIWPLDSRGTSRVGFREATSVLWD